MSPVGAVKGMGDLAQLAALVGSVALGAWGMGVAAASKPDLEPLVEANVEAIDSLEDWSGATDVRLDRMEEKLDRVLCYIETQATGADYIRCAR